MKLIRLYVENFGGLSGYTMQFEKGITSVVAPNGFGKKTLAEFIRAMFYGFPAKAKISTGVSARNMPRGTGDSMADIWNLNMRDDATASSVPLERIQKQIHFLPLT